MLTLSRECELVLAGGRLFRLFGLGDESERRSGFVTGSESLGTIDLTFAGVVAASSLRSSAATTPRFLLPFELSFDNIREHGEGRRKTVKLKSKVARPCRGLQDVAAAASCAQRSGPSKVQFMRTRRGHYHRLNFKLTYLPSV